MPTLTLYRLLLRLYPATHRESFGEEMLSVFGEMQAETSLKGIAAQSVFYVREAIGLLAGAVQEHWRVLGCDAWQLIPTLFPTRRITMHTGFRFPKATAVLMTIILAGVMVAIKQGEAI